MGEEKTPYIKTDFEKRRNAVHSDEWGGLEGCRKNPVYKNGKDEKKSSDL